MVTTLDTRLRASGRPGHLAVRTMITACALLGLALLQAALLPTGSARAAGTSPSGGWTWPLTPRPALLRGFAPPSAPWAPGHRGVDLAAWPGQAVHSAGDGIVSYAGLLAGRGVIVVVHGELRTTYEPVVASVTVGTSVRMGSTIGVIGEPSGHCPGVSCLHWGLLRDREYLDPLRLVRRRSRLLPLPPPGTVGVNRRASTTGSAESVPRSASGTRIDPGHADPTSGGGPSGTAVGAGTGTALGAAGLLAYGTRRRSPPG